MDQTIEAILKNYSVGTLVNFERILVGVSSDNYKVETTDGIYFLKQHRESVTERIDSLERLELFFSANDIPIVCPIETITNTYHCMYSSRCYVLYPYVTGKSFKWGTVPDEGLKNMAALLARLHLLTKKGIEESYADVSVYFIPRKTEVMIGEIDTLLKTIANIENKTAYDVAAEQGLLLKRKLLNQHASEINTFSFNGLSLGHGDYHPGNIFFDDALQITALFDLDMAGPLPRIYELARAIMLSCFEYTYTEERMRQAGIFIRTYYDLYPFTKEEFTHAMEAVYFKTLATWREKAHYYQNDIRTDEEYEDTIRSVEYLTKHRFALSETLYGYIKDK